MCCGNGGLGGEGEGMANGLGVRVKERGEEEGGGRLQLK